MRSSIEQEIFRKGSTTYYFSAKFFPAQVRAEVFRLYSFVRVADNYVDTIPAGKREFKKLRKAWSKAIADPYFDTEPTMIDTVDQRVIKNMVHVIRKYEFDKKWVEAFLDSMQADLDKKKYQTLDDTIWYMYGSAEVIGLMMARIMGLPPQALRYARLQGRAMQFINFLRDIEDDTALGRCYFPLKELQLFHLKDLSRQTAEQHPNLFKDFMHFQLERYKKWQHEADKGLAAIPRRLRLPLQTSVDMYNWTAREIERNPHVVFERKIRPRRRRILLRASQLLFIEAVS